MARKPIIAGNWKMNNTMADASKLVCEIKTLADNAKCEVVLCVPYTDLYVAGNLLRGSNISLGAQNVAWAEKGAFTGEISADMLKECFVEYVIIGHSERRQMFGETDETVNKRLRTAIAKGLKVILCIGETGEEREAGKTDEVNERQLTLALKDVTEEELAKVVVAYEPVWAIGTGKTATNEDANAAIKTIRALVKKLYSKKCADALRIQYGGSMNAENADGLMAMSDIDGGLIGGASLKAADFGKIINAASKGKK